MLWLMTVTDTGITYFMHKQYYNIVLHFICILYKYFVHLIANNNLINQCY
jgi:hypothetical protein